MALLKISHGRIRAAAKIPGALQRIAELGQRLLHRAHRVAFVALFQEPAAKLRREPA